MGNETTEHTVVFLSCHTGSSAFNESISAGGETPVLSCDVSINQSYPHAPAVSASLVFLLQGKNSEW